MTRRRTGQKALNMYQITTIGHEEAQRAIAAVQVEMARRGLVGVIAVADAHGELVALLRVDGAPLASIVLATNKAWTAARERKPTRQIGKESRDPQTAFDIAYYGDMRYLGWGGGVPVIVDGKVVGAVAVSGITEDDDVALAQVGAQAIQQG